MGGEARQDRLAPKRIRRSLAGFFAGERFPHPDSEDGRLVYDVLLALRGWGHDDFRLATPAFLSAARFAVFAERAGAVLSKAQAIQSQDMSGLGNEEKGALALRKMDAAEDIATFTPLLFPEDNDDG